MTSPGCGSASSLQANAAGAQPVNQPDRGQAACEPRDVLTAASVAALLGCSRRHVFELKRRGMPGQIVKRDIRVTRAALRPTETVHGARSVSQRDARGGR